MQAGICSPWKRAFTAGDDGERVVEGVRVRVLQFTRRSGPSGDGNERTYCGLQAALRRHGTAKGGSQGPAGLAVPAKILQPTYPGKFSA